MFGTPDILLVEQQSEICAAHLGESIMSDQSFKAIIGEPGSPALTLAGARKSVVVDDPRVVPRHDGKPGTQIFA